MQGLAYIDFSDDEHLAAALKKNKRILLGKKVSIARSDPKQGRKEGSTKHGNVTDLFLLKFVLVLKLCKDKIFSMFSLLEYYTDKLVLVSFGICC